MRPGQAKASTPRHLAFIVNNYPPKAGGVELHVSSLAHALAKEGLNITVFALDNKCGEAVENGVRVVRLPCTPLIANVLAFPFPGTAKRIRQRLSDLKVEVVSVHTRFFPMTYLGVRIARKLNIPAILTEHGSDHVRGVSRLIGIASRVVDFTIGRYVLRNSTRVLAISEAAQSFVWRLGCVHAEVFRNAINVSTFSRISSSTAAHRPKLVFLGRLVPGKGWEHALEVAKALSSEDLDFDLHFIGDGPDYDALVRACHSSGISGRVTVHGRLSIDDIAILLQGSILLNPSVLAEGFQTTLLEAIASGAAIVSTPVAAAQYLRELGAPIELVEAEDISCWVRKTRAYLLGTPPQMQQETLDQFDWSVRGREYEEIVEQSRNG